MFLWFSAPLFTRRNTGTRWIPVGKHPLAWEQARVWRCLHEPAVSALRGQDAAATSKKRVSSASMEPFNVESLVRDELQRMEPYAPILPYEVLARQLGRDPSEIIKLDANENPYGVCPAVRNAVAAAPFPHIYPDPESRELREALAAFTGVPASRLLVGHGADELIDLIFRLVIRANHQDTVVNAPPTFGMYQFDADLNAAKVVSVWRKADDGFRFPTEQVEAYFAEIAAARERGVDQSYPRIVFVTCPNNPDGSRISDSDLRRLLRLPTLVVLDEAYIEFADSEEERHPDASGGSETRATVTEPPTRIRWVLEYQNLIVLRTFSKWAALAGLRVGYGAFPEALLPHLWKIKQPYNVNVAGQVAALEALCQRDLLFQQVSWMKAERERLYQILQAPQFAWLHPYPSQSNFVLCRVRSDDALCNGSRRKVASARALRDFLRDRGILIRYYDSKGLTDCIRISMGTPAQMDRLYEVLEAYARVLGYGNER